MLSRVEHNFFMTAGPVKGVLVYFQGKLSVTLIFVTPPYGRQVLKERICSLWNNIFFFKRRSRLGRIKLRHPWWNQATFSQKKLVGMFNRVGLSAGEKYNIFNS